MYITFLPGRYLLRQDKKREHRRSQQAQNLASPADKHAGNAPRVGKAAVTALTTGARAARARAAANKLQEDTRKEGGGRDREVKAEVHLTSVCEVSEKKEKDSGGVGSSPASMAFVRVAAATRAGQFTAQQPVPLVTIGNPSTGELQYNQLLRNSLGPRFKTNPQHGLVSVYYADGSIFCV